jgi:hypothetical protein
VRNRRGDLPADLVDRRFSATRPNQLWVADCSCVATWRGFDYVAFGSTSSPAIPAHLTPAALAAVIAHESGHHVSGVL